MNKLVTAAGVIAVILASSAQAFAQRPAARPRPKPEEPAAPSKEDEAREVVVTVAGGITAEKVARRASSTSYGGLAAAESVNSATARTGGTRLGYAPRFTLSASYTRLSSFTSASAFGNNKLVFTEAPTGTVNPAVVSGITPNLNPVIVDQYALDARVEIPVTNYIFRTRHEVAAADQLEESARYDVVAARASSYVNGKTAYYNWVRTRGAVIVAQQAVAVAEAQLKDARTLFDGGNVTSADVLRAETAVAAAQLLVARATQDATNLDWHVRTVVHAPDEEKLEPGEALDGTLPPAPDNLRALIAEALAHRPEARSLSKSADSARSLGAAARAARYPALTGVGDLTFANPNYRKFPVQERFFPSWTAGAVLSWTPNDFFTAGQNEDDARSRAASLEAQAGAARDAVLKQVVEAYSSLRAADASVETTNRQLESAGGAYRVARQLYVGGRSTATAVLDASNALTQARFAHLNARADARIARAELDYALGRTPR